jgi:RNA polymerase sigma-70 factor (ECF subfamily)
MMQTSLERRIVDRSDCSDPVLVELARSGDEGAVRSIVKRYNRRLYRVARAVTRDDAEAEDIVQETYVRAFAHLDTFRGEAALPTWLTRIALNEALGRMRRQRSAADVQKALAADERNETSVIMFPTATAASNPETAFARRQVRDLVEQAVDELPEAFRMVFVLRTIQELSTEETAMHLAIKPETVKTRLHRAHRLIRTALDKRLTSAFTELFPFDGARCDRMADRVVRRLSEDATP